MGHQRDYSEKIAGIVDEEVRNLIEAAHDEAWHVINDNRHILDRLVLELLERETLNQKEIAEVFEGIVKRPLRPTWLSSEHRGISDQPPVLTPAEQVALNGHGPAGEPSGAHVNEGDPSTSAAIDRAATEGAHPAAEAAGEHPPTQVIEVPEGQRVDPDAH